MARVADGAYRDPPPRAPRLELTRWAVVSRLTSNHSGCGASPASWEDKPVCSVIGAKITPRATAADDQFGTEWLELLGISALPGQSAKDRLVRRGGTSH